jgi:hypothetical protein
MRRAAFVACLTLAACGSHALDMQLTIAADCTFMVPAGGGVLYEIVVDARGDGGAPRVCGGCVPVSSTITSAMSLLAVLRQSAPSCVVSPGATLHVRLDGFADETCATVPTANRLCGISGAVVAGDGHGDESTMATVSCAAGCNTACTPLSCADQGKNCDSVGDGCGGMTFCGSCSPPQKCGGGGVQNVCAKP